MIDVRQTKQSTIDNPSRPPLFQWPDSPSRAEFQTPRGILSLDISRRLSTGDHTHVVEAWLATELGTIGYMKFHVRDETFDADAGPHLGICDIEIREDARGIGFAKELRTVVEQETGLLLYSSGGFTPEGWKAFGDCSRFLPKCEFRPLPSEEPAYGSMGFVTSWSHRTPRWLDKAIEYTPEQRDAARSLRDRHRKMSTKEILWASD